MASMHPDQSPQIARLIRWTGYSLSFFIGVTLWPQLMEWGYVMENENFFLAITLGWFCLPLTMAASWFVGWGMMKLSTLFDPQAETKQSSQVYLAAMFGIVATLGSCGVIAFGYEPPSMVAPFYDLNLSR